MRHAAACALALLLASAAAPADIRFKHHFIDRGGPEGEIFSNLTLGDLDGDGRPDVIVGRAQWGKGPKRIYWYRNTGRIDAWRGPWILVDHVSCGCGGAVLDVDRDGWPDFVDGRWYRNPGRPAEATRFEKRWEIHGGHDTEAADLTGDGRPEVVVHTQDGQPGVYVYRAGPDPSTRWEETCALAVPVRRGGNRGPVHAAVAPRGVGDLDGDGDADIVFNGSWLENLDGRARRWKEHKNVPFARDGKWGRAVRCWVVDMDKDGRMDFVQSECDMPTARVAWFENVRGDGSEWRMHPLPDDRTPGDFHSLAVADFDLDGDWDVYVDEMEHLHVPKKRQGRIGMIVWENRDGKGGQWKKHVLVQGLGGHQARIGDLDGDGDVDVVTRPYQPHQNAIGGRMHVSVLENLVRRPDATGPGSGLGPESAATDAPAPPDAAPAVGAREPTDAKRTRDPADGLVAHWTFDDLPGKVATLDATRGHVDAGPMDVPGTAVTLAARFKADAFTGSGKDGRIVSKAVGTAEQDHYWMLSTWREGGAVRLRFRLKAGGKTATLVADAAGDVRTGTWTHAAAVYDGQTMRLYKDGKEVGRRAKTGPIAVDPSVAAWIGDNPPEAGSRPFVGAVDDVRIYRRALSRPEIAALATR